MKTGWDRSLAGLIEREAVSALYGMPGLLFAGGVGLLVFGALAWDRLGAWTLVVPAALGVLIARRIRTLYRLARTGIAVEAVLRSVDELRGETDFRHAVYEYEHAGKKYDFRVTGSDFFLAKATRFGDRVILVIDPSRPDIARIARRVV